MKRHEWAMRARGAGRRLGGPAVAAVLALLAGPVRAEDAAALLARAPALPLDGPVVPLAAPVEVGRAGWGPFRRLCVAQVMLRPADGTEVATSPPSCFAVEEAREDAGGIWRLSLRAELQGRGPDIGISASRDAEGRFGPVEIAVPEGVPRPTAAQAATLNAMFQAALQAHGLERLTIAPGVRFLMPLPIGAMDRDMRVEGGGFACDPEGEAMRGGRRVIVATCTARARGQVSPGRGMSIEIAGRFAIDVETGLVLRHGYASFLVMEADPAGSMGRMEMRGASRQSLE